ncbi:RNA polymerase nonessential primary-like sigma factor [Marinobacter daqiaonensis]|uniref:RNA polymerase nonessential primary-like sigma factor n=1 Tax=Marinobacter daqiaonensis TaxID=650891 RepID=A0A1I6IIZ7_9GAMM|nr:sigma-70 family RNA polymerase sigma factor [Marinobacter daqiaonensis]SFR66673.1 RNA polymerase nonessential primary-like sigma factor [Marinobacter daqiaonensis]
MANETMIDQPETLVSRYFRDVSEHDLLTDAREKRLSRQLMRCFRVLSESSGLPTPTTIREARECYDEASVSMRLRRARALIEGNRELLIRSNLRLAVHIARRHSQQGGMDMTDLIQDANVGLIKAVDRFDPARGFRFSTYAYWWITEEVRRSLKRGQRVVHTPDHIIDEIRRLQAATMKLHHQLARQPRQSELARELEVEPSRISEIRGFAQTELSTALPIGDDTSASLGDTLEDDQWNPVKVAQGSDHGQVLKGLLAHLSAREQDVLKRRFGLNRREEETLQVISEDLGISRERIRQIEKGAIKKLRQLTQDRPDADNILFS